MFLVNSPSCKELYFKDSECYEGKGGDATFHVLT